MNTHAMHTKTKRNPPPRPRCAGQQGFTLMEALVAMLLLAVGILGAAAMQGSAVRSSTTAFERTEANNIAVALMETLQHLNFQHPALKEDTYDPETDTSEKAIKAKALPYPWAKDGTTRLELPDMLHELVTEVPVERVQKAKAGSPCYFEEDGRQITRGVVEDKAGVCYLLRWAVADASKVETDEGKKAQVNKHIRVFVEWNTPYGVNHLAYTSIKYNNTALQAGGN